MLRVARPARLGDRLALLGQHHEERLYPCRVGHLLHRHRGERLPFRWHLAAHLPPTLLLRPPRAM